jgi:hypothetical protein
MRIQTRSAMLRSPRRASKRMHGRAHRRSNVAAIGARGCVAGA